MAEFAYNNFKNAGMDHMPIELNCSYHFYVSFEDEYDARFFSQETGYGIEGVDECLPPELFTCPRPPKMSLQQGCEALKLRAGWEGMVQ